MAGVYANNTSAAITAGGTTAPAAGTVESWTAGSVSGFPAALATGQQFHIADVALPTEKVTVTSISGATWTVTRGAEGTTPVAHSPGFTVNQVVTAGDLTSLATVVPYATGVNATDAANITAAITAAGVNGYLYFPPGTYIADNIAPLSGQTWYGPATIQRPNASANSVIAATGITGFTMRQLTVDGNIATSTATSNGTIQLINSTWCLITNVTVQNTPATNAAIIFRGTVRCIANACQISNVGYGIIIGLVTGDSYTCYGNVISDCLIDTTVWDAIFLTENMGSGAATVVGRVVGCAVIGCTIRNFGDGAIEFGSGCVSCTVTGCALVGISNGLGNTGINFRDAWYCTADNCTVSNLTASGAQGVLIFNLNDTCRGCSISNIDVRNVGGPGYQIMGSVDGTAVGTALVDVTVTGGSIDTTGGGNNGIALFNVNGFTISGTQINKAAGQGIGVGQFATASSGAIDGTISGVRVFNSSQTLANSPGICFFANSSDVVITGCRIGDNQATKTQNYGVSLFDATVTNITVANCDLSGNLLGPINNSSTAAGALRFTGNQGYNPVGKITSPPAVPASTVNATNTTGTDCTVYVTTTTVAVTAIKIGGLAAGPQNIATSTTAPGIRLPANQTISLTYASTPAPTWAWFGD